MCISEFDYRDLTRSVDVMMKLNHLVGKSISSLSHIATDLSILFGHNVKLKFNEILTPDAGPIYCYSTKLEGVNVKIYIGDFNISSHLIVAINSGPQGTYLNEYTKKIIRTVN